MVKKKQTAPLHPQTPPLLVFLFCVATLGLYAYIWTTRRYREVNPDAKWLSHWLVPIGWAAACLYAGYLASATIPFVFEPQRGAVITVYAFYALWAIVHITTAWWLAIYLTRIVPDQKRLPIILMAFFFPSIAVYYLQSTMTGTINPNAQFARWFSIVTALMFGGGFAAITITQFHPIQTIEQYEIEYRAAREYTTCHEELNVRYPNDEIGPYEYQRYTDAYEYCESIMQ